jgi:hypothetical protein
MKSKSYTKKGPGRRHIDGKRILFTRGKPHKEEPK